MSRPVPVRGVIEGFYGPPWAPEARLELLDFLAERGMNTYVYAPKSDPKHRERWREPYDDHEIASFRALAARAAGRGVRFGFAISPGLDIEYAGSADRDALGAKLRPVLDVGVDWLVLALDDIPPRPGLAAEQVALTTWLLETVCAPRDIPLTLVPTEYVGTRSTPYLADLAAGLPASVDVMWTGPTVCSPTITGADARRWSAALGGRRPLLWDNYPVNDGPMERSLHLGPYRGRSPDLGDEVVGVLCNPMIQPCASRVALATAADYLADPAGYESERSWERALADVGGSRASALAALAAACADGPLMAPEGLEAHRLVATVADAAGADPDEALASARAHFTAVRGAARAWADAPDALGAELAPWLEQARVEAKAALAALALLEHLGREPSDAASAVLHAFAVVFAWNAARTTDRVVFGPRFAISPAVIQLRDGQPGLDIDLAITEDRNAVDRLCRLALDAYRRWTNEHR